MKNKKGVSAIVATALILLITVAAITVLWGVVIPMVRDNLQSAQACLNAPNVLEIYTTTGMTCYNTSNGRLHVQIGRSAADVDISKINIRPIDAEGNSINIELDITSDELGLNGGLKPGNVHRFIREYQVGSPNIISVEITPVVKVGVVEYPCNDAVVRAEIPSCA